MTDSSRGISGLAREKVLTKRTAVVAVVGRRQRVSTVRWPAGPLGTAGVVEGTAGYLSAARGRILALKGPHYLLSGIVLCGIALASSLWIGLRCRVGILLRRTLAVSTHAKRGSLLKYKNEIESANGDGGVDRSCPHLFQMISIGRGGRRGICQVWRVIPS